MAGLYSQATLERVRSANDIVDVIGSAIPLKRAGGMFVALCPFHKEKSPSFNVNPHKQFFHCFGCHKGGDVFSFVKDYESVSFGEAVKRLAERAKIPLETDNSPGQQQERFLKDSLLQIHEQITQRWHTALLNEASGQIARDYLEKRKVSPEAVKLFRLGYAPDLWDDTVNWAKSKKIDLGLVERAGLVVQKEGGAGPYDRFRGRLMFPICDEQGRVIGFSGRILSGDEKTAKYVNSPETPIFTKGKVIFGLDKSKRAMLEAETAIICEGQLDLIACFMAGVRNVAAPQGTALTADHIRILKRYVKEVVLCFDADNAGQKAAVRSMDDLIASGMAIRVATMPRPHDPDSFIKEFGPEAFQEVIRKAEGFFDYYLNSLCAANDVTTDLGQQTVVRAMAAAVQKTKDAFLIDIYARRTAARMGVTTLNATQEFRKVSAEPKGREMPQDEILDSGPEPELTRPSQTEFWLLKLALLEDDMREWLGAHLNLGWVQHGLVRSVLGWRLGLEDGEPKSVAAIIGEMEGGEARSLITEAATEQRPTPNKAQQLKDVVLKLRNHYIDRQIAATQQRLSAPGLSDAENHELLNEQQAWRQMKRQPLIPVVGDA